MKSIFQGTIIIYRLGEKNGFGGGRGGVKEIRNSLIEGDERNQAIFDGVWGGIRINFSVSSGQR